ncbi:uncharacterized protein LOC115809906 [Chanos chanos]|uniref:Arginine vasopressin-induced protein 1 n=1 Tax=Chanos chanos TaxID=29144 RepID=A0A6J2V8T7_CHACN|nr:arginine vasopressin-induced protein 1 [Chanos chanos]
MEAADAPRSMVAGPSTLWRLSERRSRKAGSANIFCGVNLRQLQRLFQAAGDQDAEQRAQLVWDHANEAGLAQALISLRARNRRSRKRMESSRDALGPRWLRAFGHLRISESTVKNQSNKEENLTLEPSSFPNSNTPPADSSENQRDVPGMGTQKEPEMIRNGPLYSLSGKMSLVLKNKAGSDPERFLHRVIH